MTEKATLGKWSHYLKNLRFYLLGFHLGNGGAAFNTLMFSCGVELLKVWTAR